MDDITLRKADKSETAFLQEFAKDVINANYRDFLGDEAVDFFVGSGASDAYVAENIDETILAVAENHVVGMCVCKENLIDLIMVQNESQNQGIGSTFIRLICKELMKDYSTIRLESFEKNVKANRFYERNGWNVDKIVFDEEAGITEYITVKIADFADGFDMEKHKIINIQERPELRACAANWFHEKWKVPFEAYLESMDECLENQSTVPQWYIALAGDKIVGGLGVIENDFHNRKDLAPNVCAVYVEEEYRCQGIAGEMLHYVCRDMKERGIGTLYLITDHTSFYERYGWEFLCMVQGDGEEEMSRMYMHRG